MRSDLEVRCFGWKPTCVTALLSIVHDFPQFYSSVGKDSRSVTQDFRGRERGPKTSNVVSEEFND